MSTMTERGQGSVVSLHSDGKGSSGSSIPSMQSIVSREFFDAVFEQAQPMYMARPDGTVIYANTGYRENFRPSSAPRVDNGIITNLAPDHLDIVRRIAASREIETKQVALQVGRETEYYLSRHFPIFDESDRLIAICGSFINSTRQVNAEAKLKEEKRRFLDITRAASDWIWETDAEGRLTFVSDRVVQAVGLPPMLLKGKKLADLGIFKPEKDGSNKAETAINKHIPFRSVPLEIQDTAGEYKIFNMSGVPVFSDKGRFVGYRGTSDDITARLLAEDEAQSSKADLERAIGEITKKNMELEVTAKKALESARAKNTFLANMSHELRTPLNAVIGFAEMISLETFGPINEKYHEYVTDILNSGRHLLSLIEDILDIARIESDKIPIEIVSTPLKTMIADAFVLVQAHAEEKRLEMIGTRVMEDINLAVDPTRCLQILVNILGNAVKFTPEGGTIGIEYDIIDDTFADITIWDTGPGIAEADQEKIFEAFQQAHEGVYSRGADGVGLGLTLSLKLAKLMGGNISVQSSLSTGSRFKIRLPLAH
ncbi:MAG: PAS domain-containing sensor histidine kinase [Alphaproteobacteria bacterium]|nr:MAG: PAS domain-containing sensor histidine kinase [Alphaproteobacteria bacterium]